MTHGDNHNIKCPHCGKTNHYVCENKLVPFDKILEFEKPCTHCGKVVYYWARWSLTVDAEKTSEVG